MELHSAGPRILLVEDDASTRRARVRLLRIDAPTAVFGDAPDVETARRRLGGEPSDVALVDIAYVEKADDGERLVGATSQLVASCPEATP